MALSVLDQVGLVDKAHSLPDQLSGGEQERVAISRAIVNKPPILLADEPTGNLDTKTAMDIMKTLHSLNNEGLTIIMVTHNPDLCAGSQEEQFMSGTVSAMPTHRTWRLTNDFLAACQVIDIVEKNNISPAVFEFHKRF